MVKVLKKEDVEAILNEYDQKLEKALKDSEAIKAVDMKSWVDSPWHDFFKVILMIYFYYTLFLLYHITLFTLLLNLASVVLMYFVLVR